MLLYNPTVSGSLQVTGSLTTTGTLTAQTLVVQTITSSVDFVTGSSVNGSLSSNTHQFTGSVLMSSSLGIGTGSPNALLHTYSGTNGAEVSRFEGAYASAGSVVLARFSRNGNAVSNVIRYSDSSGLIQYGSTTGHDIALITNDAERMRITSTGNVGIGASISPVYKLEVSTAGGSERIRVGTLQNNNNTATFEAITSAGISTATSGWIRAVYGGGLALGTSTYTKTGGDSGNFANLSSESATTGLTISSAGVATFTNNVRSVISSPNCVGDDYVNVFKFVAITQGGISQKNSAVNLRVAYALTGGYGNEHCTYDLVASCNNGTWTIHTDSQTGRVANNGGNFQVSAYSSGDTLYIRSRKENGGGCGYAQMNGTVNFAGCTFSVA